MIILPILTTVLNEEFALTQGLALETSAIVSFTASITLINTQLIHRFV